MSGAEECPTIVLPADYNAQREYETPMRGYLSDVAVHVDGQRYRLFFIDPVRLAQELRSST